jgi:TRAP-type mannitol/chloroaromatic compound transport system permease small subunit
MKKALAVIETLVDRVGRAVAWATLALVLVTACVVMLRYGFNQGAIKLQESILYLHSAIFLLGAAFTLKEGGHVRVDIFYRGMTERRKALVDAAGILFLLLPTCIFIFIVSLPYVVSSWQLFEGSREPGGLPAVFLLKTLIPLAMVLLVLQGLVLLFRALDRLRVGGESDTPESEHRI